MVEFLRSIFKEDRFNQLSDTFDNFYYNYILPEVIEIQAFNLKIKFIFSSLIKFNFWKLTVIYCNSKNLAMHSPFN